ncbi:MAG: penicillin-binding protein [Candidatus Neomarinimicrobiota bacterium]
MSRLYLQYQPRITLVNGVFAALLLGITAKLFFVQVWQHEDYSRLARQQSTELETLPAIRGEILARGGESFTTNIIHYSFAVDPQVLVQADSLARLFAGAFNRPVSHYRDQMNGDHSFVWLERNVPARKCRDLLELDIPGLIVQPKVRRHYPFAQLAAPIIGFTDVDNQGIAGVELEFETDLKGRDGRQLQRRNAKGAPLYRHRPEWIPPVNGAHLYLTIDIQYQSIFEEELARAFQRLQPEGLQGVLLDPHTGQILALAQYPGFDPNRAWESPVANQRLKQVTDMYEPGSTIKVVTAMAALEENLYTLDDLIDCENGKFQYGELLISDTHPRSESTLADILAYSSNIGIIKIAEQLGSDRLYRYYTRLGLGARTGVGLRGESPGLLREPNDWSNVSTGELAMGQEIGVTTLQLAMIYTAIANGGLLLRPQLVLGVSDGDSPPPLPAPDVIRRVASRETMRHLREILYYTVEEGTGTAARIAGYKVAGKTGTAQKFIDGQYSEREFVATFAAMIPADNPRLVCLVAVDSPTYGRHFGSEAAAPIVRNVFKRILHLDNDFYAPQQPEVAIKPSRTPVLLATVGTMPATPARGLVPDFRGQSLRKALRLARLADVRVQLQGSGRVVRQSLPVGAKVDGTAICRLTLAEEGS